MNGYASDRIPFTERPLTLLFQRLSDAGIQYCVLHSYKQLPQYMASDVDMALDRSGIQEMDKILWEIASRSQGLLIQRMHYDIPHCYYYVLAYTNGTGKPHFLQLDLLHDEAGIGRYQITTSVLLQNRRRYGDIFIPDVPVEAAYLIIKWIIKNNPELKSKLYIQQLCQENQHDVGKLLNRYFGKRISQEIQQNICAGDWEQFAHRVPLYRRYLRLRQIRNPWCFLQTIAWQIVRTGKRLAHPTGLLIVLMGPDGSGKTSVGDALCERMLGGFRRTRHLHWRPGLLPPLNRLLRKRSDTDEDFNQPHRAEPYNSFISLLRFSYYLADFVLGYWLKIRMLKVRSTLVVMERYYYDYLVDTRRYRLRLSERLIRAATRWIPKPDMVVYLHNSAEELHARKQELPVEELIRQVEKTRDILPELPNASEVKTDGSLDEVVCSVTKVVLNFMSQRVRKRLG